MIFIVWNKVLIHEPSCIFFLGKWILIRPCCVLVLLTVSLFYWTLHHCIWAEGGEHGRRFLRVKPLLNKYIPFRELTLKLLDLLFLSWNLYTTSKLGRSVWVPISLPCCAWSRASTIRAGAGWRKRPVLASRACTVKNWCGM